MGSPSFIRTEINGERGIFFIIQTADGRNVRLPYDEVVKALKETQIIGLKLTDRGVIEIVEDKQKSEELISRLTLLYLEVIKIALPDGKVAALATNDQATYDLVIPDDVEKLADSKQKSFMTEVNKIEGLRQPHSVMYVTGGAGVKSMDYAFAFSKSTAIDFSKFTGSVESANSAFYGCTSRILKLFDTSKIKSAIGMFAQFNFNASTRQCLFDDESNETKQKGFKAKCRENCLCGNLPAAIADSLDTTFKISNTQFTSLENATSMFSGAMLIKLELDKVGFPALKIAETMFAGCDIMYLSLGNNTFNSVTTAQAMFASARFEVIDLGMCELRQALTTRSMFRDVSTSKLIAKNLKLSNSIDMAYLICDMYADEIDISGLDSANVKTVFSFAAKSTFPRLDLSFLKTRDVIDMSWMFRHCNIKEVVFNNVSCFSMQKAKRMFKDARIESLTMLGCDMEDDVCTEGMFSGAEIGDFKTDNDYLESEMMFADEVEMDSYDKDLEENQEQLLKIEESKEIREAIIAELGLDPNVSNNEMIAKFSSAPNDVKDKIEARINKIEEKYAKMKEKYADADKEES